MWKFKEEFSKNKFIIKLNFQLLDINFLVFLFLFLLCVFSCIFSLDKIGNILLQKTFMFTASCMTNDFIIFKTIMISC